MRIVNVIAGLMLAAALAGRADATWHVASSDHFVIYSEEPPESLLAFAQKLERFDSLLRRNQASVARPFLPGDRLTIFALPSTQALQRIAGGSGGLAGIYRPSVSGSVALTSRNRNPSRGEIDTQTVLLHEYAHHFMLLNFPATYPTWFVEGYAEFSSVVRFEDDGDISIGLAAGHRGYELSLAKTLPLEAMMADKVGSTAVLEAKGWLLTHYLTFEPARKGQLAAFLTSLNAGKPPLEAARGAFGNLRTLDRELFGYAHRKELLYSRVRGVALPSTAITVRDVGAGEAAMMDVRMNSRLGVSDREAKQRVAQARAIAAAYPSDPVVQCALAEAEDDAQQPDAADAAADRVMAADEKSVCGMVFKGRAALARAIKAKLPADDKAWAGARAWFARANRAEPENPWPMSLYYETFHAAHATPTANAVAALLAAQARAPQDTALRRTAAVQLLRDGRADDARIMLTPLMGGHGANDSLRIVYGRIGQDDPKSLADEIENGPPKSIKK